MELSAIDHVQITVSLEDCDETVRFYEHVVGLRRIPKANERPGAWFEIGAVQLHVGVEAVTTAENHRSKRHVCFCTRDVDAAEAAFRHAGVAIVPDDSPAPGWRRFYVRDPGGNRVEIGQRV